MQGQLSATVVPSWPPGTRPYPLTCLAFAGNGHHPCIQGSPPLLHLLNHVCGSYFDSREAAVGLADAVD